MAESKNPRRWVEFVLEPYPTDTATTYRWSTRALAGPLFVEGRIPVDGWESIIRKASSMNGDVHIDNASVIIADPDLMIRGLLASATTKWFKNREGAFKALSEAAYAANLTPRILFGGLCYDIQPSTRRTARMSFEEPLSRFINRTYPQYKLGDAYPYRFTEPDPDATEDLHEVDPILQIPLALRDQVMPIYYGPFIDSAVDPVTGIQRAKGLCPTFYMGATLLTSGGELVNEIPPELAVVLAPIGVAWGGWGELFVCLGEVDIPNVYITNGVGFSTEPAGTEPEARAERMICPEDHYGITVLAPGHPGWPFPTDYVMRNGFRCTVIYARGPVLWHHVAGIVNITVDVCGWKNSDGDAIDQAGFALQSFLSEHVLANNGAGYTSGPEVGLPLYEDGRAMFWTEKIQEWQQLTAERLGNTKGYLMSMALTKPTTLREILQTAHITFDCFKANNSSGQMYWFSINDLADPEDGTPIREFIEIHGDLPPPRIGWDEIENEIHFTVGYDPDQDTPRTPIIKIRNSDAIEALRDTEKEIQVRDLKYTADDATANDAMGRRMLRLSHPPVYQNIPLRFEGIDREIGEQVLTTHREGIGLTAAPMVVMGHTLQSRGVILETFDIRQILDSAIGASVESGGGGWGFDLWP